MWTGLSLLAVAVAEALWARYVRTKITNGEIGDGPGWLHPLAVARSVMIAKASAWVGALVLGWWVGVLVYLLPRGLAARRRRGHLRRGGGRGQRAGVGGRGPVAAALLQVSAGSDRARRGRRRLAENRRRWRDTLCDLHRYSQAMTVLSRGARVRRGGRRPGWVLLTALLVLAMGASSALVFTNRVELLKLAVILALWAAVAGAFVSVIYRRQSDADQSKVRDLKLVYDLQLDREISARREYELTVESQLRRELARSAAQAADEVAALRAELAALRTSLEILFDTDLEHRRALENPQPDWARNGENAPADWVSSDRVTSVPPENALERTDESPIIDVPEVGVPPAGGPPPRPPAPPREQVRPPYQAPPPPEPPPPPPPQPQWHPGAAEGSGCRPARPAATGPATMRRMHRPTP